MNQTELQEVELNVEDRVEPNDRTPTARPRVVEPVDTSDLPVDTTGLTNGTTTGALNDRDAGSKVLAADSSDDPEVPRGRRPVRRGQSVYIAHPHPVNVDVMQVLDGGTSELSMEAANINIESLQTQDEMETAPDATGETPQVRLTDASSSRPLKPSSIPLSQALSVQSRRILVVFLERW
ncbi:hypothetical protein BD626DRAFT_66026 [Schizophyllum amplum]|uniref:Uncharacterized protein n=1 Tax=Schizophyllum amplum TaxID=97359 RepID=A0A550CB77_9AGAR|nr:hypothetical protein BD626DRAFT_66026 [Auriculariopsis ampla]